MNAINTKRLPFLLSPSEQEKSKKAVEKEALNLSASLGIDVETVTVVSCEQRLPQEVRKCIVADCAEGEVVAAAYKGRIYIVANRLTPEIRLREALKHEMAHLGGAKLLGKGLGLAYHKLMYCLGGVAGLRDKIRGLGLARQMAPYFKTVEKMHRFGTFSPMVRSRYLIDEFLAVLNSSSHLYASSVYLGGSWLGKFYSLLPETGKQWVCELTGWCRDKARRFGLASVTSVSDSDLAFILKQLNRAAQGDRRAATPFVLRVGEADELTLFFVDLLELVEA